MGLGSCITCHWSPCYCQLAAREHHAYLDRTYPHGICEDRIKCGNRCQRCDKCPHGMGMKKNQCDCNE